MTIDFKNNRIFHFDEELNVREHKPISTEFKEIEVLPNGCILVIENYSGYENGERSNLYCIDRHMAILWFLPYARKDHGPMDNYVAFTTNGDRVFANTFSCYRVEIDTATGTILNVTFTK